MKFIKINAGGVAEVIELKGQDTIDYIKMKELLGFDSPVTVVERKIGDNYYDLWIDDEGLLKNEDRIVSGVLNSNHLEELLIGNMLILKHDEEGNSIGLTDEEIKDIMKPQHMIDMDDFNAFQNKDLEEDEILNYFDGKCTIKAHSNWLIYTL